MPGAPSGGCLDSRSGPLSGHVVQHPGAFVEVTRRRSLLWSRFTTRGALSSIYGDLLSPIGLIAFSPVVSGSENSLFSSLDSAWFPLSNPGLVSIPLAFVLG